MQKSFIMDTKQLTFADLMNLGASSRKKTRLQLKLEIIDKHINWVSLIDLCKNLYIHNTEKGGRKPVPIIFKLKLLFLQHLYNISDEYLEEQVIDNLSFQKFMGLNNSDAVPDFTTFWRFKEKLVKHNLSEKIWDEIQNQLQIKNVHLKPGHITIIDATIIESTQKPLSDKKREQLKENPSSQMDTDATSTEKNGKKFFGYKGHIGIDKENKVIHSKTFTTASVHDVKEAPHLASGKESEILGDKGYVSKELKRKGRLVKVNYNAMRKAARNRPLTEIEHSINKQISKTRARVEHVFGYFYQTLNYKYTRAKTLLRNELKFTMNCIMYNIFTVNLIITKKMKKTL